MTLTYTYYTMSFRHQIPIEQQNGQQLGKILDTLNALNDRRLDNMDRYTEEMRRDIMERSTEEMRREMSIKDMRMERSIGSLKEMKRELLERSTGEMRKREIMEEIMVNLMQHVRIEFD